MANILFYTSNQVSPSLGGVERVAYVMFQGLSKLGHNIWISYFHTNDLKDNLKDQIQLPPEKKAISSFIKKNRIEVCINFLALYNTTSLPLLYAKLETNIKVISVYHNSFESLLWGNRILAKIMRFKLGQTFLKSMLSIFEKLPWQKSGRYIYDNSDMAVVLAESYIEDYKYYIDQKGDRVMSIHNPLPIEPPIEKWDKKDNICLFVGRLDHQKGLDKLLRIWSKIKDNTWKLMIVGNGPLKSELEALAYKLNIQEKVLFVGHQAPFEYYEKAKIFVMTSLYEGYPMVLIESMAFGCVPVIFNSYTAAKEIINKGGYCIEAFDEEKFTQQLEKLMMSDEELILRRRLARDITAEFDKEVIIKKWDDLIKKLITQN